MLKGCLVSMDKKRLTVRIDKDMANQLSYFVKAHPERFSSGNELIGVAIEHYIAFINGDYKLPTLEAMRTNQLIDEMVEMRSRIDNLQSSIDNGFKAILQMHNGGSYLLDDDDGELDT